MHRKTQEIALKSNSVPHSCPDRRSVILGHIQQLQREQRHLNENISQSVRMFLVNIPHTYISYVPTSQVLAFVCSSFIKQTPVQCNAMASLKGILTGLTNFNLHLDVIRCIAGSCNIWEVVVQWWWGGDQEECVDVDATREERSRVGAGDGRPIIPCPRHSSKVTAFSVALRSGTIHSLIESFGSLMDGLLQTLYWHQRQNTQYLLAYYSVVLHTSSSD